MTILQQPDSLSLSGNIKEFRIGTTDIVSFVLLQGGEEIVSRSYEPGADGIVIIDIRDIIHSRLSFQFKNVSLVYEQTALVSTFRVLISGTEVIFSAIRCGIDAFADTATNFLTQNFLTWQPNLKPVTYYSPEFLTYYATVTCVAKLRAYFTDNSGIVVSQMDIEFPEFVSGKAYTIPLQYASVAEKLDNEMPAYYDVWIENNQGDRLTYIQRYYASEAKSETEQWMLFENSLGGIDTFRAYGSTAFTGEHTHNIAEIDDVSLEYRVDTSRKFQKNTGYLNKKERAWLLDFFPSLKKYLHTGSYLRSIIVVESNVTYTDKELPSNYTFTYKYADAKPLLNLPRTDVPTGALDIIVPEVGSFTVPPRLVEFPRLPLSEGALFPVQEPYSEKWSSTTAGSLSDFIAERIAKNYGGGGGVGHQHNNIDLLQLLTYAAEYLLVAGKRIKAGYADKAGSIDGLEKLFLSRVTPDFTTHLLKFFAGTEFGTFIPGMIGGSGALIDELGNFEGESGTFRSSLTVLEIIFNRLSVMESDYSFSESGTIDSVELLPDGTYNLPLRKRWDNDFTALAENDVVYGIVNDLTSGVGSYYTSWLRVLHVDTAANMINAVLYPDSEVPGGKNYPPEPLMIITRRGNPVNEERQGYWYLSSREHCICMLDGVRKPILEEHNYSVIVGRLKQLSLFDHLPIGYRDSYIFCRGFVGQDILKVDVDGVPIAQHNDRGFWTAAPDTPYSVSATSVDVVWHVGCKWLCLINGTTDEPMYGSTGWTMIEGNPEFSIDIESSEGWYFDIDEIVRLYEDGQKPFTVLNVTGKLYNGDVTDHILNGDIEWARDTSNVTEDNAWAVAHGNTGKVLALSLNDLGPHYSNMKGCKFIARALLRDGQKVRNDKYTVEF